MGVRNTEGRSHKHRPSSVYAVHAEHTSIRHPAPCVNVLVLPMIIVRHPHFYVLHDVRSLLPRA